MKRIAKLVLVAFCLAYMVVVLGAYVRLSDAGLGCPDWPVCYGRIVPPIAEQEIEAANTAFPHRPVEMAKAWKEQVHRYSASVLGLLIAALAVLVYRHRDHSMQPVVLPIFLVVLVIFQGLLGMWTVTLLLKPLFVMLHLLGGMTTLLLLWWLNLRLSATMPGRGTAGRADIYHWAWLAMAIVYTQIALGGWTSSNYAALACRDFPTCHGSFWPPMDFKNAFVLWRGLGVSYEYGVLDAPARTAIHFTHRLGAMITALVILVLGIRCLRDPRPVLRHTGGVLIGALVLQIALGVSNVLYGLPLPVAVAHNAGAALLLLLVGSVLYFSRRPSGLPGSKND